MIAGSLSIDEFFEFSDAYPLVIVIEKPITRVRVSLQTTDFLQLRAIGLYDCCGERLNSVKTVVTSSVFGDNGNNAPDKVVSGERGFSTKREVNPEVIISFEGAVSLSRIEIFNRKRSPRSYSVKVEVEVEGGWITAHDNWRLYKESWAKAETIEQKARLAAKYFDFPSLKNLLVTLRKESDKYQVVKRELNEFFFKRGLEVTNHGIARTFRFYSKGEIERDFKQVLTLFEVLESARVGKCFITSGTLLGMYRDGRPIVHDDDYDVVLVLSDEVSEDLVEAKKFIKGLLEEKGWNAAYAKNNVNLRVGRKGTSFDLFLGWKEGRFLQVSPLKKDSFLYDDIFPLSSICYESIELPAPSNIKKLLEVNYGEGWSQPDGSWKFDWKRAFEEYSKLLT